MLNRKGQFSLRLLLLAVTLVCAVVGGALFWHRSNQLEFERQLRVQTSLSASVMWKSHAPDWYAWLFPESKAFLRVWTIRTFSSYGSSKVLKAALELPDLERLELHLGQALDSADVSELMNELRSANPRVSIFIER